MPDKSFAVFPPLLPEKGTIGLVAPSRTPPQNWVDDCARRLKQRGYEVVIHDQCYLKSGVLAGSDAARAEALNDMFADSTIDAIMAVRGGCGSILMLDRLDYELIRKNPKPYVGFSDSTAVLQALVSHTDMVVFHGPMGWNFSDGDCDAQTEEALFAMIGESDAKEIRIPLTQAQVDRPGEAEGRLVGGNMSILQALIGTPYDWSGDGAILFMEDIEEPLYKLERILAQMRLAGKFEGVRAVLIGEMIDLLDEKPDLDPAEHTRYGFSFKDLVRKHVPPEIPLAFNVPCGHGKTLMTFPVGARAELTLSAEACELKVSR